MTLETALCIICASGEPAPMICHTCEARARRDLDAVLTMRATLDAWEQIDPGSPCLDERHRLALVDNPVMTAAGGPDLTVIAATDPRSRRIVSGWHDAECTMAGCVDAASEQGCTDADHRQVSGDDVVNVDAEILTEARLICEERSLSTLPASIAECLTVIDAGFDWSVRSMRADEFVSVLAACAQALRTVLKDHPERPLGRCPQPDPRGEMDACGGPLRWRESLAWTSAGELPVVELECGRCGDYWDQGSLIGLGRVSPLDVWESVPRVADLLGMSERTLRHWVMRGRVHRDSFGRVHHAEVWEIIERSKVS